MAGACRANLRAEIGIGRMTVHNVVRSLLYARSEHDSIPDADDSLQFSDFGGSSQSSGFGSMLQ